jgi:hypothetical protein
MNDSTTPAPNVAVSAKAKAITKRKSRKYPIELPQQTLDMLSTYPSLTSKRWEAMSDEELWVIPKKDDNG